MSEARTTKSFVQKVNDNSCVMNTKINFILSYATFNQCIISSRGQHHRPKLKFNTDRGFAIELNEDKNNEAKQNEKREIKS